MTTGSGGSRTVPSVSDEDVRRRLQRLAGEISRRGALRSPQWRRVFTAVHRHVFVPRYLRDEAPGAFPARWRVVDGNDPRDHHEWINTVYSDVTLVTDLKTVPVPAEHGGGTHPIVTSSSTLPGLMLRLLEELEVRDGMRVLEIGTGTGYNAALLCERLGAANVTSIDIDPCLVATARQRLAAHGYHPHLMAGDGAAGVPENAPYDRVLATCGVHRVPYAWVEQTRPGGMILTHVWARLMPHALIRLIVHEDGTACGRFLSHQGSFMPLRHDPTAPFDHSVAQRGAHPPTRTRTRLDPAALHRDPRWGFFAELSLPGVAVFPHVSAEGAPVTELRAPDGSWAVARHTRAAGGYAVTQAGPRRLWDEIEHAHGRWVRLGRPGWSSLGLTVTAECQRVWAIEPERVIARLAD